MCIPLLRWFSGGQFPQFVTPWALSATDDEKHPGAGFTFPVFYTLCTTTTINLGCILLLWAELHDERPELAELLTTHHMAWAELALQHAAQDQGFYGHIARTTAKLLAEIRSSAPEDEATTTDPDAK